jgi:hypothetical protein
VKFENLKICTKKSGEKVTLFKDGKIKLVDKNIKEKGGKGSGRSAACRH